MIKIGQKLFVKPNSFVRNNNSIKECHVSKVGRKYFELEEIPNNRFFIEDLIHDGGNYTSQYKCYLSMEEIENEEEAKNIYNELRKTFSKYVNTLPLDKLKEIKTILDK